MRGKMLVLPRKPMDSEKLESGLYTAPQGIGARVGTKTERTENAWWPVDAVVISSFGCMSYGTEFTGEYKRTNDGRYVRGMRFVDRHGWRTPQAGETVHVSYKTLNPNNFIKHGDDLVDSMLMKDAYCVTSVDGVTRGNGAWAMLEQLPSEFESGLLVTSMPGASEIGVGIVRYAGDGFLELQPDAVVGSLVAFMVIGKNNVAPNPKGGRDLVPVIPEFIVGIDPEGIPDSELESMWNAADSVRAEIAAAMSATGMGGIVPDTEAGEKESTASQIKRDAWARYMKVKDKNVLHEKRMTHH